MKFSVVMFAPKIVSCGPQPRNAAAAWRAWPISSSLWRLLANAPPRFAFDVRRYAEIASITESGHCVPPGASSSAVGVSRAEKRARTASTSSATVLIAPDATALR